MQLSCPMRMALYPVPPYWLLLVSAIVSRPATRNDIESTSHCHSAISCGLYSYGLYSYGLYSYGLYSYGLYRYGHYHSDIRSGRFSATRSKARVPAMHEHHPCAHRYAAMQVRTHATCGHAWRPVPTDACMQAHGPAPTCTPIDSRMHARTYTHTCMHVFMHTHTYIRMQARAHTRTDR